MAQFRYAADRKPVAIILALTALDVFAYLSLESFWAFLGYWLLMFFPKGLIAPWNHHHQHCMTFRSPALNRLLELAYGLHTGMTTHLWVLHHVLGHHVNYLDQQRDESRWKRKDGTNMGVVEYSLSVAFTSYPRAYKVGARYPKQRKTFVVFGLTTFAVLALLLWYRPMAALFVYALPMVSTLIYTSWVTYDHHAGLESSDHFTASYNILNRWFNKLTGNLGYHTAHHYKQGLHWSKLPALHASIAHKIAPKYIVRSTFDAFLPSDSEVPETPPVPANRA